MCDDAAHLASVFVFTLLSVNACEALICMYVMYAYLKLVIYASLIQLVDVEKILSRL